MKMVIVDTDVVSYLFKHDTRAMLYHSHLSNILPALSFMTLAELERWAISSRWGASRRQQLTRFLQSYVILYPDASLCRTWGAIVEQVRQSGYKIAVADAWIAATALQYGIPLITHNRKDYAAITGLTVISEAP